MEKLNTWYLLVIVGIFASACSQLLLKTSANKNHSSFSSSILNFRVVLAYTIFLGSLIINIMAMNKGIGLKDIPILESLGYIFVPTMSLLVLKEKMDRKTCLSILTILLGVIIFYL